MIVVNGAEMSAAFTAGLVVGVALGLLLWLVILPALARLSRHDGA